MLLEITNRLNYLNLESRYYFKKSIVVVIVIVKNSTHVINFGLDICTIYVVPRSRNNIIKALLYYY